MATDEIPLLEALFYHLVLPPKLPRSFDGDNIALAQSLAERLQDALSMFRDIGDPKIWKTLETSFQATKDLNQNPQYQEDFQTALKKVSDSDGTMWLGLHIVPQNAALIIHYDHVSEVSDVPLGSHLMRDPSWYRVLKAYFHLEQKRRFR